MIVVEKSNIFEFMFYSSDSGSTKTVAVDLRSNPIKILGYYDLPYKARSDYRVSILEYLQIKEFIENTGKTCDQLYDEYYNIQK